MSRDVFRDAAANLRTLHAAEFFWATRNFERLEEILASVDHVDVLTLAAELEGLADGGGDSTGGSLTAAAAPASADTKAALNEPSVAPAKYCSFPGWSVRVTGLEGKP